MSSFRHLIPTLALAACGFASQASACPLCKDTAESAVDASGQTDDDPLAEAKAYNRSIYMMIGVPYTLFAVGGFYCYRHLKNRGGAIEG